MHKQDRKRGDVIRLCERLLAEQDPEIFAKLAKDLIALLEDKTWWPEAASADSESAPRPPKD
jgi:hypothetical protein